MNPRCEHGVLTHSTPLSAEAYTRGRSLSPGQFVIVEEDGDRKYLAIVTGVDHGNYIVDAGRVPRDEPYFEKLFTRVTGVGELATGNYYRVTLRILGQLSGGSFTPGARSPPLVGSCVRPATDNEVRLALSVKNPVRVGEALSQGGVEVSLPADSVFKHVAVLAMTGYGKSNATCTLVKGLVKNYRATVVLLDFHGEYLGLADDPDLKGLVVIQKGKLDPFTLSDQELVELLRLPSNAVVESLLVKKAFRLLKAYRDRLVNPSVDNNDEYSKCQQVLSKCSEKDFASSLMCVVKSCWDKLSLSSETGGSNGKMSSSQASRSALSLLNRLDDSFWSLRSVLSSSAYSELEDLVVPHKLNIYDMSEMDLNEADVIASYLLRRLLNERKIYERSLYNGATQPKGYPTPVVVVIEEAHVLVPADENTQTRYWAARIAREGRKFGVGLILVSQRPRGLDIDVLSQTSTKLLLRMVEPKDLSQVSAASESLGEDLANLLPGLRPGEGLVLSDGLPVPALVKFDACGALRRYSSGRFVEEWVKGDDRTT